MTDPERIADAIAQAIEKVRTDNRLEAMWSPLDPEIPMTEPELDEFLRTFAQNPNTERLESCIRGGITCETRHTDDEGKEERCTGVAIGSIDFYAETFSDSVLICRQDVRPVYKSITDDIGRQGLTLALTINGKAIPQIPEAEKIPTLLDQQT